MDYKKKIIIVGTLIFLCSVVVFYLLITKKNKNKIDNNIIEQNIIYYDNVIENVYITFDENGIGEEHIIPEDDIDFLRKHPDYNPNPIY